MQSLQEKASEWSGVDASDAFAIDSTNLFEKLGLQTFVDLSTNFYNRVFDDEEEWFRSIFAGSKKEDAIQNQYEFFVQRMGGPPLYSQRKGHPALIGRHRPFPVTHQAAERWLHHMQQALDSVTEIDADSKIKMLNFFRHTAFFLVAGDELKSRNQTVPCKHAASKSAATIGQTLETSEGRIFLVMADPRGAPLIVRSGSMRIYTRDGSSILRQHTRTVHVPTHSILCLEGET